ncbi:MAG: tetratricopeptide repeat protein [Phycisphaerales bacterium]|nr:tetratricopeptide repeat protein [Phycisphaerales bacterium]
MPSIAQLEKLLALEPGDAFLLYGIAQEHAKANDHEKAVDYFEQTIKADPDYTYAYFHIARSLESLDREPDAIAYLEKGHEVAKRVGDAQGISEIAGYLDGLR